MLQQIRIQNFRSLKDVTLNLQQVNLLIGPNNSGKSNLLKALEFLRNWIDGNVPDKQQLDRLFYNRKGLNFAKHITFRLDFSDTKNLAKISHIYQLEIFNYGHNDKLQYNEFLGEPIKDFPSLDLSELESSFFENNFKNYDLISTQFFTKTRRSFEGSPKNISENLFITKHGKIEVNTEAVNPGQFLNNIFFLSSFLDDGLLLLKNIVIQKPDPTKFVTPSVLSSDSKLNSDASNLVSFLFNLGQNHKKKFKQLEEDLKNCVGDIVSMSTPAISTDEGNRLKLKFFDREDKDYWADEVSEGVLYFLALLCIIHQPDPPKLLLLEEPEKGIHPRRIKEVMDFIFQLAEDKNIQIILTSHSVHVVDEFSQMPESVFVFDKDEEGATIVRNLQTDIIAPADKKSEEEGVPPIHYTEPLSEHWVMGFLGGVPQ